MLKTNIIANRVLPVFFILSILVVFLRPVHAESITTITPTAIISPIVSTVPTDIVVTATPTTTPSDKITYVDSNIIIGTQRPWDKKIPVKVTLTPKIDANRMELKWQNRSGFEIVPATVLFNNVVAGKTYTYDFIFQPKAPGLLQAAGEIILTTSNSNYLSNVPLTLTVSSDLIITPQPKEYQTLFVTTIFIAFVLVFFVIPFGAFVIIKYLKNVLIPKWIEQRNKRPV